MSEVWKDIPGYEGFYQMSDLGNIRSLDRLVSGKNGTARKLKGHIMRPSKAVKGLYSRIQLRKNNKVKQMLVHRLVMLTFVGPCPIGEEVLHGPAGISVNSLQNLKYGTHSKNTMDRYRDETVPNVRKVRRSEGVIFPSIQKAARKSNAHASGITLVCQGKRKTTSGFGWEYINV